MTCNVTCEVTWGVACGVLCRVTCDAYVRVLWGQRSDRQNTIQWWVDTNMSLQKDAPQKQKKILLKSEYAVYLIFLRFAGLFRPIILQKLKTTVDKRETAKCNFM